MAFAIVSTVRMKKTATLLHADLIETVFCAAIGGAYPVLWGVTAFKTVAILATKIVAWKWDIYFRSFTVAALLIYYIPYVFPLDVCPHSHYSRITPLRPASCYSRRLWTAALSFVSFARLVGTPLDDHSTATARYQVIDTFYAKAEPDPYFRHMFLFLTIISFSNEFDEFGRRRPVMGRQPPPSYAQAMGNASLMPSNVPITSMPVYPGHQSHRIRYEYFIIIFMNFSSWQPFNDNRSSSC